MWAVGVLRRACTQVAAFLSDESEDEREPFFVPTEPAVLTGGQVIARKKASIA